ncbi:AraC family transcriptional regulator [Companilactobacillus halodurans]|uniref:Helix-turn-helix domain-containing protein n=1 Tax=Companilactobacillus halodurans TaxID=2584183 RepID=A0A5P0ZMW0_9LACO|nr:helix-turn-helix domain-containing protein [Companilactobacillus halodurans]MQS75557.1 helix-turn-helix domain-containing protein [Companilactobacillus halodurans]MQS97814.1 helix-turn-helix domain-containing protein [Companilactobacillus halodurans]
MNLDQLLRNKDKIEERQFKNHAFVMDFPQIEKRILHGDYRLNNELFFKNNSIYISKHHRFAPYPLHSHQFLEMNYMYSGKCREVVNGHEIILHKHDIILLDTGSKHKIDPLNENDILVNFLFKRSDLNFSFLTNMSHKFSPSLNFVLNAVNGDKDNSHKNFMLIKNSGEDLPHILERTMEEYFFPKRFSNQIINHYVPIIFFELARAVNAQLEKEVTGSKEIIVPILFAIENDYSNTSLEKIANQLNYSKNYISNLIKEKTGRTFSDILNEQRMQNAYELLTNTELPIGTIIERVGISNRTYFYSKFKDYYKKTPKQIRMINKKKSEN